MAVTPGTIAEFDIILSISEEAINRQLNLLYDKKIEIDDLPVPTEVENAAPAAPAQYLINHDLEIHLKDEDGELDMTAGISGHIKCPKISFTDVPAPNDFRTARMSFTFERVEGIEKPDSTYTRWVKGKPKSTPINGWTMSWLVKLGRNDIQNVMEDLINPAKNNEASNTLHPKTIAELEKVADNRCFLVSSVFCLFEATQMANTFELRDQNGAPTNGTVEGEFMLVVSKYYTGLKVRQGTVTPDNPFVLGYGISQKVPDIREINPEADPDQTPRFFIPRKFQMTTTPGSIQPNGEKFTNGTLNFCMVTHRDYYEGTKTEMPGREEKLVDPQQNLNAGKLDRTFFDVTRTSAHDGVMGFCKDIIIDKFINQVLGKSFYADPSQVFDHEGATYRGGTAESWNSTGPGRPPSWTYGGGFRIEMKRIPVSGTWAAFHKAMKWSEGHSKVTVTVESDLLNNPATVTHLDTKRRTYITLVSDTEIRTMHETQSFMGDVWNETWTEQYLATLYMKYQVRLIVSAGNAGVWDVSVDHENTILPKNSSDGHLEVLFEEPNHRFGSFVTGKVRNGIWHLFGEESELKNRMAQARYSGDTAANVLTERLKAMLNGMKNRIIMPAGDVFMFTGIDVDDVGNLYSHVSYAQGAEGTQRA